MQRIAEPTGFDRAKWGMVTAWCENNNEQVETLIWFGLILKTIAQIDIVQSNLLIESLFLVLKHRWFFLRSLDALEQVKRAVEKYLIDRNNLIPRVALRGATPQINRHDGRWMTKFRREKCGMFLCDALQRSIGRGWSSAIVGVRTGRPLSLTPEIKYNSPPPLK